jgi:peroxiredoxin
MARADWCTGLLCLTTWALTACGASSSGSRGANDAHSSIAREQGASTTAVVEQPPDFELDAITGDSVRLGELVGKHVILLDFWATYCDPCLQAMPHLQKTYAQYREQGFVVLGISIDGPESVAHVRSTVAKLGVEFPILLDSESRVVALYNPRTSAPYSVLIGRDGRILTRQEGFTTGNAAAMEDAIRRAVGGE